MTTKNEILEMTVSQLRAFANDNDVAINSKMKKTELLDAIVAFVESDDDDNTLSVADLARELGVNPKIARAKLRRRGVYAKHGSHVRFVRDDEVYSEYVAIITSTRAKASNA